MHALSRLLVRSELVLGDRGSTHDRLGGDDGEQARDDESGSAGGPATNITAASGTR
jgi:hypothetical protein